MTTFSNDVDVLKWEPALFAELHLPSQTVATGTGATLSGTTLTAAGANFVAAGIEAGDVIHLRSTDGSLEGSYEIVSVQSATALTVSVVRSSAATPAVAPPAADNLSYRVSTLESQAVNAAFELTQCFAIRPGDPRSEIAVEDLLDTEGLRQASVLRVIASAYAAWATRPAGECFWRKVLFYEQLFEKAKQRCRLPVDRGADGVGDATRVGGAARLLRD